MSPDKFRSRLTERSCWSAGARLLQSGDNFNVLQTEWSGVCLAQEIKIQSEVSEKNCKEISLELERFGFCGFWFSFCWIVLLHEIIQHHYMILKILNFEKGNQRTEYRDIFWKLAEGIKEYLNLEPLQFVLVIKIFFNTESRCER